ncbi:MAG: TPR end-of-group domain-containing protein [Acidobacteriota bacterium]
MSPKKKETFKKNAYGLFEEATGLFNNKKYKQALALFQKIKESFPEEIDVVARANSFIKICNRQLQQVEVKRPTQAEGLFDLGVVHHNSGSYDQAMQCFEDALKLEKKDKADYIYYAMASTEIRQGNSDQALKNLKKAIQIRSENRFFARNDPDFERLSESETFQELVGPEKSDQK